MFIFFLLSVLSLNEVANQISGSLYSLTRQPKFKNIAMNLVDPCNIDALKEFIVYDPKHRVNYHAKQRIDLTKNPETNTGYTYGAKEVWTHLFNVSSDPIYQKIMSGLKFSIHTHICTYFLKTKKGYVQNPKFFFKNYKKVDHKNFNWLIRVIYSKCCEIDLKAAKIPMYIRLNLKRIFNHINKNIEKLEVNYDFDKSRKKCNEILNCIGCQKCKLWGKVQIRGLYSAFKIKNDAKLSFTDIIYLVHLLQKLTETEIQAARFFAKASELKKK